MSAETPTSQQYTATSIPVGSGSGLITSIQTTYRTLFLGVGAGMVLAPIVVSSFLNNIPLTVSATSLRYGLGAGLGGAAASYAAGNITPQPTMLIGAAVVGAILVPFMAGAPINAYSVLVGGSTVAGGYAGFYLVGLQVFGKR